MTKKLARLLRADIQETSDLKSIAAMLAGKGRGGDTLLAHITPKEVGLLKEAGGAGTVNPDTGLLEFYDWSGGYGTTDPTSYYSAPSYTPTFGDYSVSSQQDTSNFVPTFGDYSVPAQSVSAPAAAVDTYTSGFPGLGAEVIGSQNVVAPAVQQAYEEFPPGMASSLSLGGGQLPQPPSSDSFLKKYVGDPLKDLKATTGLSLNDLLRLGGAGAGALVGRRQNKEAAKQIQQATQEQKNLGLPYQERGRNLMRSAESGELTPQGQQALEAARAQAAQNISKTGGVGVAQAQAQIEALRQNLLQNQYNFGLQVSQIGDQITLGAIRTGMQLDQQLNQSSQQFYTQLAQIAGGGTYGYNPQQVRG